MLPQWGMGTTLAWRDHPICGENGDWSAVSTRIRRPVRAISSSQVTPDGLRGLSQNVARSLGLSPARAFRFCTSPVLASGCILAIGISALGLDRTDASVARICEA